MRFRSQIKRDENREVYLVTFPTDLSTERVLAWLRSVTGTLPKRFKGSVSSDTLVFETCATSHGIKHRLMIPKAAAEYIAAQLRTHGRGVTVTKDTSREDIEWSAGVEVGMSSPYRQLRITSHADLAASLLGSVQALQGDEVVMIQWIVTPAPFERPPSKDTHPRTVEFSMRGALMHPDAAMSDEINDRRQKLEEQNLLAVGRIMTRASDTRRADELIIRVQSALAASNSAANYFRSTKTRTGKLKELANQAATPLLFPAQLSLPELAAVIAWPIGQPFVAGLPQGATRHLFPTEDLPAVGRIMGDSNYPGHERPVALSYDLATMHEYLGGKTGTGKSTHMANGAACDMAAGYGVIVIDASNSNSTETLFQRVMGYVPEGREAIVMDVANDVLTPVGFNVLDQGNPRAVADQIKAQFAHLYRDTTGVWTQQLLFYGIYTLAERKGLTLVDLPTLINPMTDEEKAWAKDIIDSVENREIRAFWHQRWNKFSNVERERFAQPLLNRIWQLVDRPEVRNIIGQSESSFQVRDVLENNKILLVSLSGLAPETASILGTLIVNSIWNAAQSMKPEKANFLYLDEFQVMTNLPFGLDDMLNRSRKHSLGVVMATQYLEDVPTEVKNAVVNNARTKIIFQSSAREARTWQPEFGRNLEVSDFMSLNAYEVIAQVASPTGGNTPVTLKARPPQPMISNAYEVKNASRQRYGRPINTVYEDIDSRRVSKPKATRKRPPLKSRPWEE